MQWDDYNDWLWSSSIVRRNYINGDMIEIADVNEKLAELKDHHHWGKDRFCWKKLGVGLKE